MKPFLFILVSLLFSCKYDTGKSINNASFVDSAKMAQVAADSIQNQEDSLDITTVDSTDIKDTIVIPFKDDDTLFYTKADLDSFRKYYPVLNENSYCDPDESYAIEGEERSRMTQEEKDRIYSFGSEAGQDQYYMLYAYFGRKRDGIKKYAEIRAKMLEIFRLINALHAHLNNGGTYFGHQYKRIEGYAEYAVRQYSKYYREYFQKDYSIKEQLLLFMASLKQFAADEINSDKGLPATDKSEKKARMFSIVNQLGTLITDYFCLKQAQEFEYDYY